MEFGSMHGYTDKLYLIANAGSQKFFANGLALGILGVYASI